MNCKVELHSNNAETVDLYCLVRDQVIVSPMGDIIGPNKGTILKIIELFDIENKRELFIKVLECFRIMMEIESRGKLNA